MTKIYKITKMLLFISYIAFLTTKINNSLPTSPELAISPELPELLTSDLISTNNQAQAVPKSPVSKKIEHMTLEEARQVVETVSSRLDPDARIIWGAQISEDLTNTIRTMLIVTGVSSPQIFGPKRKMSQKARKEIEQELGIEFIS